MKKKPPKKEKYIETPERLWQLFKEYEKKEKANPIKVKDWVGKDGFEVEREKETPLTMEGFELYCFENQIINDLGDYFSNKGNRYQSYATVCSRIRLATRHDQIRGGMAGIYNASITQRLNGLIEKSAVTVTEQPLFPDVPPDTGNK